MPKTVSYVIHRVVTKRRSSFMQSAIARNLPSVALQIRSSDLTFVPQPPPSQISRRPEHHVGNVWPRRGPFWIRWGHGGTEGGTPARCHRVCPCRALLWAIAVACSWDSCSMDSVHRASKECQRRVQKRLWSSKTVDQRCGRRDRKRVGSRWWYAPKVYFNHVPRCRNGRRRSELDLTSNPVLDSGSSMPSSQPRNADVLVRIYSRAAPRYIDVHIKYHCRSRMYSIEWFYSLGYSIHNHVEWERRHEWDLPRDSSAWVTQRHLLRSRSTVPGPLFIYPSNLCPAVAAMVQTFVISDDRTCAHGSSLCHWTEFATHFSRTIIILL